MSNDNVINESRLQQIKTRAAAKDLSLMDEDFDGFSDEELQEIFLACIPQNTNQKSI